MAVETLEIAKHDERGRRIADPREKEALVAGYASSGMTQKGYAEREGISRFTLATWLRKKRQEASRGKGAEQQRFVELGLPKMSSGYSLEVVLPEGLVVRGSEAKQLAALVRGLR